MRIATFNINGMNARQKYLLAFLREVQPDVVGIQELKAPDELVPHDELNAAGYQAIVHGQKSWNGVAVLTRVPATVRQVGLPGQERAGARLLAVEVEGLTFATVYVPNGKDVGHGDFGRKLDWLDSLIGHVADHHRPDQPFVLAGDFNLVPAPIDSWNEERLHGKIFHTDEERSRLARLLGWGLHDVWREQRPAEPGFTWWDYRAGAFHRHQGLRIDLILATAPLAGRVRAATLERKFRKKLDGLIPSDHAPTWIDVD